jgi:hypothetical protein
MKTKTQHGTCKKCNKKILPSWVECDRCTIPPLPDTPPKKKQNKITLPEMPHISYHDKYKDMNSMIK